MTSGERRAFWSDPEAIHIPQGRADLPPDVESLIGRAAADSGLRPHNPDRRRQPEYRYTGGRRAFGVVTSEKGTSGAEVAIQPAYDSATDDQEAEAVAGFATQLCLWLAPPIARSFSFAGAQGHVDPDELDGSLRWIDWWQYLGARAVERVGRRRLLGLSVFEVKDGPHGGLIVRATRSPHEAFRRRPLAEALSIQLKPMREWHPETQTWSEREWPI